MPHIGCYLYPGRDEETKRKLAKDIKAAVSASTGFPPEALSVSLVEYTPETFQAKVQERYAPETLYEASDYIHRK